VVMDHLASLLWGVFGIGRWENGRCAAVLTRHILVVSVVWHYSIERKYNSTCPVQTGENALQVNF